jgi:glycosyltransferase involved in cell wall biosynthesis
VTAPRVLVVSADTTTGWRTSARELVAGLERCHCQVDLAETGPVASVRTFMLTDLVQARAARALVRDAERRARPDAVIYCAITTALLWPRPGAIWLDAIAAANRPGRHGWWQRAVERRRLAQAPVVLAMSERALDGLAGGRPREVAVLPVPVEPSAAAPPGGAWSMGSAGRHRSTTRSRDIAAITYAGNPEKKRLATVLDAWERARREGETLVVAGLAGPDQPGTHYAGRLPRDQYRALLRRARVFIAASAWEDYGTAQLEALADGCRLAAIPGNGPYPALELARRLDPRLVTSDLAAAIRIALDDGAPHYAERARELLVPFGHAAFDRVLSERVLPALLG